MHPFFALPAVAADRWQMQQGERFALDGLLAQLRPRLAIEVGTFEGGSLRRIAAHAEHVHAFDLDPKVAELAGELDNVTFHIGDSAELLPQVLAELGREGRHVDFALVDAAHTREAVRGDGAALLGADACRQTVRSPDSATAPGRLGGAPALAPGVNGRSRVTRPRRPMRDPTRAPGVRRAPEFVPIPALHEAYAAAQERPRRPRQGRRGGLGGRCQRHRGRRRGRVDRPRRR